MSHVRVTCSLGGEVEDLLRLGVAEEVPGEDPGLVLSGAGEVREPGGSLPGPSSLTVDTRLPGLHLHLPPLPAPGLPVLDPEAGDLGLALAGPGQGVGVGVEADPGTGEGGRSGEAGHQDRGVGRAELVVGLALVRPEHFLAL